MAIHKSSSKRIVLAAILIVTVFLALTNTAFAQGDDFQFEKPPTKSKKFSDILFSITDFITKLGIPVISVFLILSGFMFVSAQGNMQKLESAKSMFYWTVVGAAIVVGAGPIAKMVLNLIDKL